MKKVMFLTLAALTLGVASTGCVGRFAMFNSLAKWNTKMSDSGLVQELVFLVLWIIPVYQICGIVDIVVFNSLEFWGKGNPGDGIFAYTGTTPDGATYAITSNGNGTATLSYKGESLLLSKADHGFTVSKEGVALGTATVNGSLVTFTQPNGTVQSFLRAR
ncbi:MAG: DUF3332 family protein [Kiritimatiellia bacterium]